MDILGYVKKFKNVSREEKAFNDVDIFVFAELAYLNFHIFPNNVLLDEIEITNPGL